MGKQVFIKVIPRDTASKIHEVRDNRTGKKLNKTKINDQCKDTLQALWSPTVGGLKTGLYKKREYGDQGEILTLQQWAERKWGLETGFLTNKPWRRGDTMDPQYMTYFQKKSWKLNDGTTILDLDNLDDFCFYHVCLESKYIANSEREWKEHKWPKARYYIALENESDTIKYKKTQRKAKAFAALHDKDLTLPWKRKFVVILEIASDRITLTEEQVNNLLYDFIDKSALHDGATNINQFLKLFEALKTKDGREHVGAQYLLKRLDDWRIVIEKAGTYTWLMKDMQIGYNKKEAIDFLLNPKKQALVDDIIEELNTKKAGK
jgi:hypothetical protein